MELNQQQQKKKKMIMAFDDEMLKCMKNVFKKCKLMWKKTQNKRQT